MIVLAQAVGALISALAFGAAVLSPRFRDANVGFTASAILPLALGIAAALFAATRRGLHARAGAWFALAIAGQGAALALIDAPAKVTYQHYRISLTDPVVVAALVMVLLQAMAVAVYGRRDLQAVASWLRRVVGWRALLVVLAATVLTSAALSLRPLAMGLELAVGSGLQLLAMATVGVALAAAGRAPGGGADRLVDRVLGAEWHPGPRALDKWVWWPALGATAVTVLLAWFAWERHPHVPDEVNYLFQAGYFAQGSIALPLTPVREAFSVDLMWADRGRWYSVFPPGWPAILAVGVRLGAPWLVNPVLTGVCVLLCYLVLGSMYDRRTTRLGTLLLAGSPWFLFLGMGFMSHAASLACALAAALGVARARQSGSHGVMLVAGMAIGMVGLIRPLEGVIVAVLLGCWSLVARGRAFRWSPSVVLTAGAAGVGALTLPYNAALTGSARTFPVMAFFDRFYGPGVNNLGFGPNRGVGWGGGLDPFSGHGLIDVVANGALNAFQVNVELLGWATGAVFLVVLGLVFRPRELTRADWWQLAAIVGVVAAHALYYFNGGPDFGARYWYLLIVPCVALCARAVLRLSTWAAATPGEPGSRDSPRLPLAAGALALVVVALLVFVPWRAMGKYDHYRGMRPDVRSFLAEGRFGRSLVLVRGRRHPDYASAAVYNPLDLRSDGTVFAWDLNPDVRRRAILAYPDRPVWFLDGPTRTGRGFRVAAGPLAGGEAMDWRGDANLPSDTTTAR